MRLILLKEKDYYLLGKTTELDEEPAIMIEDCFMVEENFSYRKDKEELIKEVESIKNYTLFEISKEGDEHGFSGTWVTLAKYPKYTNQRHLFLTSDSIFSILEPQKEILDLYRQVV